MSFVTTFVHLGWMLSLILWHPPAYCVLSRLKALLLWEGSPFCMFIYEIMDVDQLYFEDILKRVEAFITTNSTQGLSSPWLICLGSHNNFTPRISCLLQGEMRTERKRPIHWSAHQPLTDINKWASGITCFGNEFPKKPVACCQSLVRSIGNSV